MKKVTKEFKMQVDVTPLEDEDDKMQDQNTDDVKTEENGEQDMSSIASALQNINDAIANIDSRLNNLESGDKIEEEINEDPVTDDDEGIIQEDLKGVPERPQGKKSEKPATPTAQTVPKAGEQNPNPIPQGQTQVATGDSPGNSMDPAGNKDGDDNGAEGKVLKPSSDITRPAVKKNSMDSDEDDTDDKKEEAVEDDEDKKEEGMEGDDPSKPKPGLEAPANPDAMKQSESYIDVELKRLKEHMDKLESMKRSTKTEDVFKESNSEDLTQRQSVAGNVRSESKNRDVNLSADDASRLDAAQENYLETKSTVASTIKEYLAKSSSVSPATRRMFGMR